MLPGPLPLPPPSFVSCGVHILSSGVDQNVKNKSTKIMENVTEEVHEEGGPVVKEKDGAGKDEGKKTKGSTAAPTTTVVKKKKGYSMPQSLNDVWILSPTIQQQFIQKLW